MLKIRQMVENISPITARVSKNTTRPVLKVCVITFGVPSDGMPSDKKL